MNKKSIHSKNTFKQHQDILGWLMLIMGGLHFGLKFFGLSSFDLALINQTASDIHQRIVIIELLTLIWHAAFIVGGCQLLLRKSWALKFAISLNDLTWFLLMSSFILFGTTLLSPTMSWLIISYGATAIWAIVTAYKERNSHDYDKEQFQRLRYARRYFFICLLVLALGMMAFNMVFIKRKYPNINDPVGYYRLETKTRQLDQYSLLPINEFAIAVPGQWQMDDESQLVWSSSDQQMRLYLQEESQSMLLNLWANTLGYGDSFELLKSVLRSRWSVVPNLLKSVLVQDGRVYQFQSPIWQGLVIQRDVGVSKGYLVFLKQEKTDVMVDFYMMDHRLQATTIDMVLKWLMAWKI